VRAGLVPAASFSSLLTAGVTMPWGPAALGPPWPSLPLRPPFPSPQGKPPQKMKPEWVLEAGTSPGLAKLEPGGFPEYAPSGPFTSTGLCHIRRLGHLRPRTEHHPAAAGRQLCASPEAEGSSRHLRQTARHCTTLANTFVVAALYRGHSRA